MKTPRLLFVCFALVSSTAVANPVMTVMKLSAEVTGSTHVRLRYLTNYGSPSSMTTYGTSHSDWFTTGENTSSDNGSGLQTMTYQFMCDCHVPTGSPLTYQMADGSRPSYVPASNLTATVSPSPGSSTLCDDKCALADRRDAGADGVESTGLAGASGGSVAPSTSGAGGNMGAGGSAVVGGSNADGKKGGGGCSFDPRGGHGVPWLLLAMGLLVAVRRRSR